MDVESWKTAAADEAAKLVRDGMLVGLGSGTTVAKVIAALSRLNPNATYVVASSSSEKLAKDLGLKLSPLDGDRSLDITIDGADEVDPNFDLIKGHGGAHTREKIIAQAAKRVVIVVDRTKLVRRLGKIFPVPVEVLPFAKDYTMKRLAELGSRPVLKTKDNAPFVTDNGNYLVEAWFPRITNAAKLEQKINGLPGVIDNGLFAGLADLVYVGHERGCTVLRDKRSFLKFLRAQSEQPTKTKKD